MQKIVLGIEGHPAGWTPGASVTVRTWAAPGTTFVTGKSHAVHTVYVISDPVIRLQRFPQHNLHLRWANLDSLLRR
jgi:hypothetical protein